MLHSVFLTHFCNILRRIAATSLTASFQNHLIETASHSTGSLLIWDTGEYEVLPRHSKHDPKIDPDSQSVEAEPESSLSQPEKLSAAFRNRKIKLRLHGTRLPKNYTIGLRLDKTENRTEQPDKPTRKRKRKAPEWTSKRSGPEETPPSSDDEVVAPAGDGVDEDIVPSQPGPSNATDTALERELGEAEDEQVRRTNAYPGASNTIGSIHQRRWYLSLDRVASGFYRASRQPVTWRRKRRDTSEDMGGNEGEGEGDDEGQLDGFEPFFVRGREVERSVVTGRTAEEVMQDEGVVGYVMRKGWRPVLE